MHADPACSGLPSEAVRVARKAVKTRDPIDSAEVGPQPWALTETRMFLKSIDIRSPEPQPDDRSWSRSGGYSRGCGPGYEASRSSHWASLEVYVTCLTRNVILTEPNL